MCDLLAPLLVILDDGETPPILSFVAETTALMLSDSFLFSWFHFTPEAMAFSCFTELMKRMNQNFPHGGAMDTHFANMRSLIQVTTHFCLRLFILHQNMIIIFFSLIGCRFWTLSCLSWCTRMATTPTSTSATGGFYSTSNEVKRWWRVGIRKRLGVLKCHQIQESFCKANLC